MSVDEGDVDPDQVVVMVWRAESARIIGALTRLTGDVGLAEDLAQDALVAALEQWPSRGVPTNPAAWLMAAAKRRAVDQFRRADMMRRKVAELGHELEQTGGAAASMPEFELVPIEDDVLRLIFLSCHPALTSQSRAALTLRLVGGLTTAEIARGFLVSESTMAQRISRAKRTLADAHAEFDLPVGDERIARFDDVMAVIYLIFNEGYAATAGLDWMRPELALEAMRLSRMLAVLAPEDPNAHSLQALLELQGSRMAARRDESGAPVLMEAQDRSRWDQLLLRRGLAALERATVLAADERPSARTSCRPVSPLSTPAPHAPRKRTGAGSPPSTTSWPNLLPDRSSRRIGQWLMGGRSAPTLGSPSCTPCPPIRSAIHRSSRASSATCSSGPAVTRTLPRRSPKPPGARRTTTSEPFCDIESSTITSSPPRRKWALITSNPRCRTPSFGTSCSRGGWTGDHAAGHRLNGMTGA